MQADNSFLTKDQGGAELYNAEKTMIKFRFIAVLFALLQVETYYLSYPAGVKNMAYLVVGSLLVGNVIIYLIHRYLGKKAFINPHISKAIYNLAIGAMVFDFIMVFAFVSIYTFDFNTAIFIMIYLLPLAAAVRFQRRGALIVMTLATAVYAIREIVGSNVYGYDFFLASVSFRMGIGFLIAGMAGSMANRYIRERSRVEELYLHEYEAADALRQAADIKNTFLKAMSHEFRTPLTIVSGFATALQERAKEILPENKIMLEQIVAGSQRLNRLLDDMINMNKLIPENLTLNEQTRDIGAFLAKIGNRIGEENERVIEIRTESLSVSYDEEKLERAVENILINAIKYSNGKIWLKMEVHKAYVIVVIEDEGPGVPDYLKRHIFKPFRRGEAMANHQPGAGIGLSVAQTFIDLHQGKIWVEDKKPTGASFKILLPFKRS